MAKDIAEALIRKFNDSSKKLKLEKSYKSWTNKILFLNAKWFWMDLSNSWQ